MDVPYQFVKKDGEVVDVLLSAVAEWDDQGAFHRSLAVMIDVSTCKQAEEHLHLIVEAAPYALFLVDRDGNIVLVNAKAESLFGYTREEMVGQPVEMLMPERFHENHRIYRTGFPKATSTKSPKETRRAFVARHKDGREFAIEIGLTPLVLHEKPMVLSAVIDVTEKQQAQADLREGEERFRKIFEHSNDAIFIIDPETEQVLDVNPRACAMLGYERHELQAIRASDIHRFDLSFFRVFGESVLAQGHAWTDELTCVAKTGEILQTEISASIMELSGRPLMIALVRDVTKRKQVEHERERLIAELEAKNAELERFTYTVSHDLKSPLVTIKGFLGLLEKDVANGNAHRIEQDIQRIKVATDRMDQLLRELLELSQIGRVVNETETVSLSELAHEAITLVAGQIADRGVEVVITPDIPNVVGDRLRLLEVFQNLIDNAVKFMGTQPAPCIEIGALEKDGETLCYVRDNGAGVDSKYHEKVFGLFERLDTRSEGTGIGLALVKRIIEVHGGRIWLESEGLGRGSTFFFTLPTA